MTIVTKEQLVDYDSETGRVRSTPQQIHLEVSSHCNLKCIHCPTDFGRTDGPPREFLPIETVHRIAPWLESARFANLNGIGEPMLCPSFDAILDVCRRGTAEIAFNTNGLLLTPDSTDKLVAAGVHSIAVSVDGIESNQPIRGTSYESVVDGILALHEAKRRARSEVPHIAIAFTVLRRNVLELPRLVRDLVKRVDIHSFQVQPLVVHYETLREENPYRSVVAEESLREARAIAENAGSRFIVFRSASEEDERNRGSEESVGQLGQYSDRFGCIDPFFSIGIQASGNVVACSGALDSKLNIRDMELDEIWNHPWFCALRKRLFAKSFTGQCEQCSFVHCGIDSQIGTIREGVHHSQESRFFRGGYGRRQPRRVFEEGYAFLGGPTESSPAISNRERRI